MGWIRVSDDFYDNDKLSDVGPLGVALYFAAMGFCNRKLSDGYFKKSKARMLLDFDGIGITTATAEMCSFGVDGDEAAKTVIEWLVAADLWHEQGHDCDECHARDDGGEPTRNEYLIHDYLKFQPSRAEVEAKAEANRKRVESWRESRKAGRSGNDVGNAVTSGVRTESVTEHVQPNPNPNPNPSSFPLVTSSGGVTSGNARASSPRPHCPRHEENAEGVRCRACKLRREWDEAREAADKADELAEKRRNREIALNCPLCQGTNVIEVGDDVVRKCTHPEVANG